MTAPPTERVVPGRRRLPERDVAVDILGVLTIAVYGSWYYGFGVLIDDIGDGLSMSATQLGVAFGLAHVLLGVLSLATGRILDRHGPSFVLGLIGPVGAIPLLPNHRQPLDEALRKMLTLDEQPAASS